MHKQHEQTVRGDARRDWVFMKAIVVPYTLEAQWRVRLLLGQAVAVAAAFTWCLQEVSKRAVHPPGWCAPLLVSQPSPDLSTSPRASFGLGV